MTTLTPELTLDTVVERPSDAEQQCHAIEHEDETPLGGLIEAYCGRVIVLDSICGSIDPDPWLLGARCPDCHRPICPPCRDEALRRAGRR